MSPEQVDQMAAYYASEYDNPLCPPSDLAPDKSDVKAHFKAGVMETLPEIEKLQDKLCLEESFQRIETKRFKREIEKRDAEIEKLKQEYLEYKVHYDRIFAKSIVVPSEEYQGIETLLAENKKLESELVELKKENFRLNLNISTTNEIVGTLRNAVSYEEQQCREKDHIIFNLDSETKKQESLLREAEIEIAKLKELLNERL